MTEDLSKPRNTASRFDAPGCYAYSADHAVVPPDEIYFEPWISRLQAMTERLTSALHSNGELNSEEMSSLRSVWSVARMGRDANPGTYPGNLFTSAIQLDASRYLYKSTSTTVLTAATLLSFQDHEKLLCASGLSWQQSIIWNVFLAVAKVKWPDNDTSESPKPININTGNPAPPIESKRKKHRASDTPTEADLLIGRKVLSEMTARNFSVEDFRNAMREKGHKGSDIKFGKVLRILKSEQTK